MLNKVSLLMLLLLLVIPAQAQTATPTATPTATTTPCTPGIDVGNLNFGGNCQSNSLDPDMRSDLYRSMATAAADVNNLPEQINSGQSGSIIPSTSGAIQLFGYIKWLFSMNTAQEVMGKTLAPFGANIFVLFFIVTTMTALYFLVNFIVLIVKAVVWVFTQFLKLIPFW